MTLSLSHKYIVDHEFKQSINQHFSVFTLSSARDASLMCSRKTGILSCMISANRNLPNKGLTISQIEDYGQCDSYSLFQIPGSICLALLKQKYTDFDNSN